MFVSVYHKTCLLILNIFLAEIYHIVSQSSTANDTPGAPDLGEGVWPLVSGGGGGGGGVVSSASALYTYMYVTVSEKRGHSVKKICDTRG